MTSQWHSLISQKIFLAKTLLSERDRQASIPLQEALWQGATELSLRSRQLLLVMLARIYQDKQSEPISITELRDLPGEAIPEIAELETLATSPESWWVHLDQLGHHQTRPPKAKKTINDDSIIAVSVDNGPDQSSAALHQALDQLNHLTDVLADRHSEW